VSYIVHTALGAPTSLPTFTRYFHTSRESLQIQTGGSGYSHPGGVEAAPRKPKVDTQHRLNLHDSISSLPGTMILGDLPQKYWHHFGEHIVWTTILITWAFYWLRDWPRRRASGILQQERRVAAVQSSPCGGTPVMSFGNRCLSDLSVAPLIRLPRLSPPLILSFNLR
jgi:hypothetical protein